MVSEEELKDMSPEQVAEMQKQNCIFCHIVEGKVQSKKIFEDDSVVAILDINPANPGHVLLMPKEHYSIMPLVPENVLGHMFMVAKAISNACLKALKVEGTNIFVANGAIAGQKAPHFMIHVIPRKDKDGLEPIFNLQRKEVNPADQEQVWVRLKAKVNEVFGIEGEDTGGEETAPGDVVPNPEAQSGESLDKKDEDLTDLDTVSNLLESGTGSIDDEEDEETEEDSSEETENDKDDSEENKSKELFDTGLDVPEDDGESEEPEQEEAEDTKEEKPEEQDDSEEHEETEESEEKEPEDDAEEETDEPEEKEEEEKPESTNLDDISKVLFR